MGICHILCLVGLPAGAEIGVKQEHNKGPAEDCSEAHEREGGVRREVILVPALVDISHWILQTTRIRQMVPKKLLKS